MLAQTFFLRGEGEERMREEVSSILVRTASSDERLDSVPAGIRFVERRTNN